jgi:hypothetical protein
MHSVRDVGDEGDLATVGRERRREEVVGAVGEPPRLASLEVDRVDVIPVLDRVEPALALEVQARDHGGLFFLGVLR